MSRDRVVRRTCLGSHRSIYEWGNSERPGEDRRAACPVCGKRVLTEARTGKMPTHAPPLGHITRIVKVNKEPDMQTNQTPEALAEEIKRLVADAVKQWDVVAEIVRNINRLRDMAASGAKDAERYAKARHSLRWSINPARVATCAEVDAHVDAMPAPTDPDLDAAIAATKRGGA